MTKTIPSKTYTTNLHDNISKTIPPETYATNFHVYVSKTIPSETSVQLIFMQTELGSASHLHFSDYLTPSLTPSLSSRRQTMSQLNKQLRQHGVAYCSGHCCEYFQRRIPELAVTTTRGKERKAYLAPPSRGRRCAQLFESHLCPAASSRVAMAQPSTAGTSEANAKKRKCDLDTNSLECPNCFGPFFIPVYQCRNGHSACSACRKTFSKGCPTCSHPVDIRIAAIEKIIECAQVPCKHALHGCTTKMKYSDRDVIEEHENKLCEYRPLQCPMQSPKRCLHIGPGVFILSHLAEKHGVESIESCLGSGQSTRFTMKATCPLKVLKTEKAWLLVNCWRGRYNFGSFVFCTVFGSSKVKVAHKLSLKRVRLRGEEKNVFTYTCLHAVAPSHSDLDLESITLEDILVGPYIYIPHEDQELSELEFDLKVTVL